MYENDILMITIPNPGNQTLQQLLPRIQEAYPDAKIRKIFLSPEAIFIPQKGYKFVVRERKGNFKIDHTLPVLYAIGAVLISVVLVSVIMSLIFGQLTWGIGGALWIVLGIFIMKYVFQVVRKDEFERFKTQFGSLTTGFDFERGL